MANNSARTPGSGESIRTIDKSSVKTAVSILDLGGSGTENLSAIGNSSGLFIQDNGNSITVDNGGTFAVQVSNSPTVSISGAVPVTDNAGSLTVDNPALSVTGGGVEASALRVTIANDSTGVVSIDDNGGSLTVDGTVAATQSGTWNVGTVTTLTGITNVVHVDDNSGSLTVDGTVAATQSGTWNIGTVTPGTAATNLGKAEDAAHASGDTGVMALAVRSDAGAMLASTDGDYVPLTVNASGALYVTGGGGGTQYVEDAAAAADPTGNAVILVRKDTPAATVSADGDNIAQRGTNYGAAYVTLLDTGGSPVSVGGGTQYTEDAASAADPIGTQLILRRRDTLTAAEVSADGDVIAGNSTSKGELYVKHTDAIPVTDNSGSLTVDQPTGTNLHTVVDSGTITTITNVVHVDDNSGSLTVDGTVGISGTVTVDSELTTADLDTGAGTDTRAVVGLALAASGGALLVGSANPVPISDNSGSLTVDNAGTFAVQADTELPAAAAMSDTISRTLSTPQVGVLNMLDNGSNYVRQPGDVTGGAFVQGNVAADAAVSGKPLLDGGRASTAIPTAMSADGDAVHLWLDRSGAVIAGPRPVATATLSNVSTSTASANLLASNTSRRGVIIYNDAAATLYVKFGSTASSTSFTYLLLTGETLELQSAGALYTGTIDGILASGTGTARVTELTP